MTLGFRDGPRDMATGRFLDRVIRCLCFLDTRKAAWRLHSSLSRSYQRVAVDPSFDDPSCEEEAY